MKYLLLFLILFFPLKLFLPYHFIIAFAAIIVIVVRRKIQLDTSAAAIGAFIIFLLLTSIFRSLYLNINNPRDYIEIFRFIPLLLLLLIQKAIKFERADLEKIFFWYVLIDFVISIAQFLRFDFINIITSLYAAGHHAEKSLLISSRALGLSSGPGQHGSLIAFLFVFFLSGIFFRKSRYNVIGVIISSICILLSQSQTAFIAMVGSSVAILLYYIFSGKLSQKLKALRLLLVMTVASASLIGYFFQELRYLASLVEQGTDRNSFQVRLEKAQYVYDGINKAPELLITGYGKDYWGSFSAAMDNEYLYFLAVYGIVILVISIAIVLVCLFRGFLLRSAKEDKSIYFIILTGLVIAYPTAFFTDPRIILLLLFVVLSKQFISKPGDEKVPIPIRAAG